MVQDSFFAKDFTTTQTFTVIGGRYLVTISATFGGGDVTLKKLAADGSTYVDLMQSFDTPDGTGGTIEDLVVGKFLANGAKVLDLSGGAYELVPTTASAVYAEVARVPLA